MTATEQTIAELVQLGIPHEPTPSGILIPHAHPNVKGFFVDAERGVWRPKRKRRAKWDPKGRQGPYRYRDIRDVLNRLAYDV